MCRHVHVALSEEERQAVRKLSGVLIPAYAMVALAIIGLAAFNMAPRSGELVASAPVAPSAAR
jgi:hypothetical protein